MMSNISLGRPWIQRILLFGVVVILAALFMFYSPEWLISEVGTPFLLAGASLLLLLLAASADCCTDRRRLALRFTLVVWFFLTISEEFFVRADQEEVAPDHFSMTVFGEIGTWVLCAAVVLIIVLERSDCLSHLFSKSSKWVVAFGGVCILSVSYSPRRVFSAAWSFKLLLVILLIHIASRLMRKYEDVTAFLATTLLAFSVAMFHGALADPSTLYVNGRLGYSPTSLAVTAGIVLVLSLAIRTLTNAGWPLFLTVASALIMLLSGGKAGIAGGLLSAVLYFLFKKKLGSAVAVFGALALLGVGLLFLSPSLHSYASMYSDTEQAENLTGRTDLWDAAVPLIMQRPIQGHGYMASRYISLGVEDVGWQAGHLHNAFLDVLYNNGLIGLMLILYLHFAIIRNFLRTMRQKSNSPASREISAAGLAVYANLLINAFFNAIIGGRLCSLFMLFLGIYMVSEKISSRHDLVTPSNIGPLPDPACPATVPA